MQALPNVDVLIVFECREWEAAEYVRDVIASGQKKALIQLPHEGGEEAGMEECARWLRTFVTEVPIGFIPSGAVLDAGIEEGAGLERSHSAE
jgi:hypothetical protein